MIPIKEFFIGGRAVFTIEVPNEFQNSFGISPHYTYKILRKKSKDNKPDFYFVYLLAGPNNTHNYSYIGKFNPETGQIALTAKSKVSDDAWSVRLLRRSMARIFEGRPELIEHSGFNVYHEGKCGKCGKKLTTPESVKTGLGPICSKRT